jgi:hypothetical protein
MPRFLLALLIVLFAVEAADARKRRHYSYPFAPPFAYAVPDSAPQAFGFEQRGPRMMPRSIRGPAPPLADLVPPGWQLQPPDPGWAGKRFLSPDGASWFAIYRAPANDKPQSEHMKAIAFAGEDEIITYLRGERDWISASGFKGSRIFYRKAILACGGRAWHHIAFEYAAELRRAMDQFVAIAAYALDNSQSDCETPLSASR